MNEQERKEYMKEYRKRHKEKLKEYSKKWRESNPKKVREGKKRWAKNNLKKGVEYIRKWKKNNPKKVKAHNLARKIKIPKNQLCEICGIKLAVDKHHTDYNKPLNVQFLCRKCHYRLRGKNG